MNDLLDLLPDLHRAGATNGGEFAGPCPWCGGNDRFRVWPTHPSGRTRYWCRRCGCRGDGVDLLRELKGMTFHEAAAAVGQPVGERHLAPRRRPQEAPLWPPDAVWQSRAEEIAQAAAAALWQPECARALAYLRGRGFADETLRAARLGHIDQDIHDRPGIWGLPSGHNKVWVPRGIAIPWRSCGSIWRLNIRRPAGKPKYCGPAGFGNALYGADGLRRECPVVLVEGEFDALAIAQEAGDLVTAVAAGSTQGARRERWIQQLRRVHVFVAFDGDDPGEQAAAWWLDALPGSRRLAPVDDPAAMLQAGQDLRQWVMAGLR